MSSQIISNRQVLSPLAHREIDAQIAKDFLGICPCKIYDHELFNDPCRDCGKKWYWADDLRKPQIWYRCQQYSRYIGNTWEVIDKLLNEGFLVSLSTQRKLGMLYKFKIYNGHKIAYSAESDNPGLSVCLAVLELVRDRALRRQEAIAIEEKEILKGSFPRTTPGFFAGGKN